MALTYILLCVLYRTKKKKSRKLWMGFFWGIFLTSALLELHGWGDYMCSFRDVTLPLLPTRVFSFLPYAFSKYNLLISCSVFGKVQLTPYWSLSWGDHYAASTTPRLFMGQEDLYVWNIYNEKWYLWQRLVTRKAKFYEVQGETHKKKNCAENIK